MGLRFQKRIKLFQGVFLCLSKGGVSLSIGNRNIRINLGKRGLIVTGSAPGAGLSWREQRSWKGMSDGLRRSWRNRSGEGLDEMNDVDPRATQGHFDRGRREDASAQTTRPKLISKPSRLSQQGRSKTKSHRKPHPARRRSIK